MPFSHPHALDALTFSPGYSRRELEEATKAIEFNECTLMREPDGGWWVAPQSGGEAFINSLTRWAEDLEQAVMFSNQIQRKRTGNY